MLHIHDSFQGHAGFFLYRFPVSRALVGRVDIVAGVGNRGYIFVQLHAVKHRAVGNRPVLCRGCRLRDAAADRRAVIGDRAGEDLRRTAFLIEGAALVSGGVAGNFGAGGYDQIAADLIDGAAVGRSLVVLQVGVGQVHFTRLQVDRAAFSVSSVLADDHRVCAGAADIGGTAIDMNDAAAPLVIGGVACQIVGKAAACNGGFSGGVHHIPSQVVVNLTAEDHQITAVVKQRSAAEIIIDALGAVDIVADLAAVQDEGASGLVDINCSIVAKVPGDFAAVHRGLAAVDVDRRAAGAGVAFRQVAGVDDQLAAAAHHEAAAVGGSAACDGALPGRACTDFVGQRSVVVIVVFLIHQRQGAVQGHGGAEAMEGVTVEVQRHVHTGRHRHILPGVRHHDDLVVAVRMLLNILYCLTHGGKQLIAHRCHELIIGIGQGQCPVPGILAVDFRVDERIVALIQPAQHMEAFRKVHFDRSADVWLGVCHDVVILAQCGGIAVQRGLARVIRIAGIQAEVLLLLGSIVVVNTAAVIPCMVVGNDNIAVDPGFTRGDVLTQNGTAAVSGCRIAGDAAPDQPLVGNRAPCVVGSRVNAAAAVASVVIPDFAAVHFETPEIRFVSHAAAVASGGVVADSAAVHGQTAGTYAAAVTFRGIAVDFAAIDRDGAARIDSAAVASGGVVMDGAAIHGSIALNAAAVVVYCLVFIDFGAVIQLYSTINAAAIVFCGVLIDFGIFLQSGSGSVAAAAIIGSILINLGALIKRHIMAGIICGLINCTALGCLVFVQLTPMDICRRIRYVNRAAIGSPVVNKLRVFNIRLCAYIQCAAIGFGPVLFKF